MKKHGVSFCIITGGHRNDLMELLIASIRAMKIPDYEILVCGIYRDDPRVDYMEKREWAQNAEVCKMRNFNAERAGYDTIVILDDDVEFAPDWYEKIKDVKEFDLLGCRGIDSDGRRCWDYQTIERGNPLAAPLPLDYNESHKDAYISGYFMMMKSEVWEAVKFDEKRRNYQHDDVDFCHRATDIGYSLKIVPDATVTHHMDSRGRKATEEARASFIESHSPSDLSPKEKGMKFIMLKDYKNAITAFKKAEKGFHSSYNLAYSYQQVGAYSGAIMHYLEAVNATGEKEDSRMAAAFFHLGEIYLEKGVTHLAESFLEIALEYAPGHKKAQETLGEIRKETVPQ